MPGGATEIVNPSARFGPLQSRLAKGTQRFEAAVLISMFHCAGRSTGHQGFATSLNNGLCMSSSKSTQRIFPSFHLYCTRLEGSITPRRIRKTAASSLANSSAFLAVLQFDTAILTAPTPPQLVIVTNIFRVSLIALTRRFAESFTSGGYSVLDFPRKRTMFSGTTRLAAGSLADMSLTSSYHCPPSSGLRIH